MQITVDLAELDALGRLFEQSQGELSGLVTDIRRRLVGVDFAQLTNYRIDPSAWLSEVERSCSRLTDDVLRLDDAATELRRRLVQAGQDQPGALGPYAGALPDAAWYRLRALPERAPVASSGALPPPAPDPTPATATSSVLAAMPGGDVRQRIVATAEQWVGIPYLWGGGHGAVVAPRGVNVDCSGLVHEVFGENGLDVNGTAATMYASGTPVPDLAHALPGDLLFWGSGSDIHHVAIYIGNGMMIEAPHTGAWVHATAVYGGDFAGIRRVLA
jgi:cell wall-associated NlpC family hydrolase